MWQHPRQRRWLALLLYPSSGNATFCGTGNNGNLQSQAISIPGLSVTQTYSYDAVNRLTQAQESGSPGWTQGYGYDTNGNRWVSTHTSGAGQLPGLTLETPQSGNWFTASNRINNGGVNPPWGYDANGNLLQVGGMPRSFTYDAENRQVTATIDRAITSYSYDGNGQRVAKTVGEQTVVYVYDAFGNLAAEYGSLSSPCGTATCYVTTDHLGSTRMLTDTAGPNGTASSNVRRYDYLPFGQEILQGTNGRMTTMGYLTSPDSSDPKFTGQYRDPETSTSSATLDWFNTRYMSGGQGRFQSVDPANAGAALGDPQSWNAYAYVSNNPLSYTDPNGLGIFGDIGSIIGSFFPGLGTLIGWGIGSIADLATGQSISPPGIGIGTDIFGSIAGSVNNGQPWNEQWSIGGGSLNTGTVFGSGDTGPFINNILRTAGGSPEDVRFYAQAIAYLERDVTMSRIIRQLRASRRVYTVTFNRGADDSYAAREVRWDPTSSLRVRGGGCQSAALGLGHELAHAYEHDLYPYWFAHQRGTPAGDYENQAEKWAITGPEASAARTLGEPIRHDHIFGDLFVEPGPTSRRCR